MRFFAHRYYPSSVIDSAARNAEKLALGNHTTNQNDGSVNGADTTSIHYEPPTPDRAAK